MNLQVRGHEIAGLLDRLPDGVTTLSLDCFDTLLWRRVQAPRDVFASISLEGGAIETRASARGGDRRAPDQRQGQNGLVLRFPPDPLARCGGAAAPGGLMPNSVRAELVEALFF